MGGGEEERTGKGEEEVEIFCTLNANSMNAL